MDVRQEWIGSGASLQAAQDEVWLLGQPPLDTYLDFVGDITLGGALLNRAALVDEWRAANDHYYDLEKDEAGIADAIEIRDLDGDLAPLVAEVMADARFRRAFDTLPTRFAMVELDRLVVSQPHVSLGHSDRLKARLGPAPSAEALFRCCIPLGRPDVPLQMRQTGSRRFLFWSECSDIRFQEAAVLRPDQIQGYDPIGPLAGIIGLMVGFGSNFLNVIESDTRLLLHNGHHRAYALRELGITHAPCIVQTVTRRDELNLVASRNVVNAPAFYFKAARPPLLKDFFDPKLRKVLNVRRIMETVELSFEVKTFEVADFATG